jgi:hypothetical protein
MFFSFSFSERHLKELKKHNEVFYKLCCKLSIFSQSSIEELITNGKENGITKITERNIYKTLQVDTTITLYKFRISNKIRCYCKRNLESSNTLDLIFIDANHLI